MSLEGAKFICLDEAGNHGEIVLAKGRKFTMGYYVSCDFVLVDERAKGVHCEIECDAFGRVTIRNLSPDKPILVNGSTVEIKRILLNNSKLSILDKEYLWQFPKNSSNEFEDLPVEAASTPQKQIGIPEQPPNSCPDFKLHRELPKRFTVHNFAYCIQSDEEGNTSTDSNDENSNEGESSPQTKQYQTKIETDIKENQTTDSKDTNANTQEKEPENHNRSVTPEPKEQQNEKSTTSALMETPKMNLINCTKDKENKSTQKKNKQLLTMCHQSDVVITSFSPRETGVRIEKSFATVVKPKVLVTKTPATPKSVYSTPKSDLNEDDDAAEDEGDERELLTFHTPSTSKKGKPNTASTKVLKNSSMHLIDLTTPNKLRPASPYLKSALKASAKKKTTNVDKSCGKLSSEEQLGLSALPSTPALQDNSNSPLETPSSVISVSSSTDTSSIIEVTSDGSNIGCTPVTSTGMATPVKAQTRAGAFTPKRTPQSLMKRALITSAKKQNTTPQRNLNTATTPRRESINRIPLRSNLALLRTPVTPQASVGDKSTSQLPRRQSMSTPTRKSMPARSRFDSSPSTSNLASPSSSNRMASRRSSINPISAARALPTSTPVSGSSNNSALRTRAACKTSPLHKVRKSIGGVPLSSHISKARRSIVLPASTSKITSIKEKSPQQVMSDRLVTRARKSLCLTPISARSRNMVTAAKTPPQAPSSILKAKSTQSAKKPERKAVLFADKQPAVSGEVDDLSRTFIIDSDEEENAENPEDNKPKDATFSPEKETKEADKNQEPIEIPVDVEEITSLSKENKELDKTSNEENSATTEEKEIAVEETEKESTENKDHIANNDKTKSIVTEESFAEIINDSQETEEQEEKRITETIEITDSPKETSQTESQESFTDALEEIVEENIKETEINQKVSTEEPAKTLTQQSEEKVADTGFGEESIVEIIETTNSENILQEDVKNGEETTENDQTESMETNEVNNDNTNEKEKKLEIEKEVVQPEETKSLELQEVEEKVDEQKSSIYKPIVEDITLEGSLIEKETNVSKQPLYEDITLELSLIEEKFKSEEIKDETSKESNDSNKILQTDESLKEEVKQHEEDIASKQETESLTLQKSKEIEDDKDVLELSQTNQNNKETLQGNPEEKVDNSEILEKSTTSKSEEKSPTLFIEKIDNDLDDTSKLLEEIEDVLNKSDEIKQKHLIELEEGKLESEKPLTEEFESEKLTQEITEEETVVTNNEENNELPEVTKEAESQDDSVEEVQQSLDIETTQQVQEVCNQNEKESEQVAESLSQEETSKSSKTDKTDEISMLSTEIVPETESPVKDIDLQNEDIVEGKKENTKVSESPMEVSEIVFQNEDRLEHKEENLEVSESIVTTKDDNISEEDSNQFSAQEESEIKETENTVQKDEEIRSGDNIVKEQEDPLLNEQNTDLNAQEESSEINETDLLQNKHESEEQIPDTTSAESKDSEPEEIEIAVQSEKKAKELEFKGKIQNDENAEELKENEITQSEEENVFQPKESSLHEVRNEKQTTEIIPNEQHLEKSADTDILNQEEDIKCPEKYKLKVTETVDKHEKSESSKANAPNECEESKSLENIALQMEDNTPNEEKTESTTPDKAEENKAIAQDLTEDQVTKSSDGTVKDTISHSEAHAEQKEAQNANDLDKANKSGENTNETEKPKELSSISNIKKKIENSSSLTPRRSTRRASMSAETTTQTTTATESSFTPRRSTRRASMSAETTQTNSTTESSFTPRRSARRASMSAETTTTATPTKRTTRRASLSVVSETTPLTPKTISKRRVSIDDDTVKPSTSKTPRKLLEQRMVIPEEIEEVVESVIVEEEEENVEEKKTIKKRRSSTSSENKTSRAKTPLKQLESEEMSKQVVPDKIEEQDEPAEVAVTEKLVVETKQNEEIEKQIVDDESLSKDSIDKTVSQENLENLSDVTNLAEKEKVEEATETAVSDAVEKSQNIDNDTTEKSDILTLAAEKETFESEQEPTKLESVSEEKQDAVEDLITTDNQTLNENAVAETLEKETEEANLATEEKKEEGSVKEQDDALNSKEKSNKEIIEELPESSNKTDEVDKVHVEADNSLVTKEVDNLEKSSIGPEVKEILDSSAVAKEVDLNTSQITADEQSEDEMENLQFEDDVETTPRKTDVKQPGMSTPVTKKSVKILADTPKTPLMAGMRDLLKTPKAEVQTPRLAGLRDLVRTPKEPKESEEEEMEKLAVVADLIKTPKASKETLEVSTPPKTKKQVTIIADSPKTPLMTGMRELLKTPKAEMHTPQMVGIRHLVKTPKTTKESEQEEQEKLAVVAELVKTPQASKNVEESVEELPSSSRKNVNLQGVKELLKTPKSCSTPRFKGMRELMQTPKVTNTPIMGGVKELLDTPAKQEYSEEDETLNSENMPATTAKIKASCMTPCGVKDLLESPQSQEVIVQQTEIIETEDIPCTTSKTSQDLKGVKELLKTPKTCSTPRLKGIRELMQTPKMSSTPIMGGIKELMDSPAEKQHELDKFLRTPTAKNIMIPSMPSSAIIEKSSDSIEISTEYDLNASHDDGGETANLEELFKTPVASRFVERITDSYYGDDDADHDETVEKFEKKQNESLDEALNKSAEEAFDKMVGQESQIQTPIRKIYKRKSYALQTPQAPSPFSAADVLSDLPKTDVEEWIETLEQAEAPSILECEDYNEAIVEPVNANESVKEMEEVSLLEQSTTDSIIPETCTKVYLTEKSLTNITTGSITKTLTKDPLLSATAKLKEKESRPLTPIDAEISGLDLLDQTVDSVQDEQPSMLDEPLLVEEPSMFEEPLVVSDDDDECVGDNTLNNANAEEISQDEANDLSEPLMVSDSEDLNQSQEIESNEAETKQESNIDENVQEKSMVAQVSDVSLAEDPLESKNKQQDASIIVVEKEEEDKSIIEIEDDSNAKEASKVEDELTKDVISESETLAEESLLFEETPMKAMLTSDSKNRTTIENSSEPQNETKNDEVARETAKNSEEEFAEVVDATETDVIEKPEKAVSEKQADLDAKEISIEQTKVESNTSEDIFLDSSVTEICEETIITNEEQETKDETIETNKESLEIKHEKSAEKETKQQLEHECQNIFMDNSNIDESFADEAVNEENDVENESAMVEVTTKEVIKERSWNIPAEDGAVLEATNEEENVQESEKVLEEKSGNNNENEETRKDDHIESVKANDDQQHFEETESLTPNKLEEESCEKESEQAEVTADNVEEPSDQVSEDLESSQICSAEDQPELPSIAGATSVLLSESLDEKQADVVKSDTTEVLESSQIDNTAEEQAELTELPPAIESKTSETSAIQLEDSDEKDAEVVESDTAEVLECSHIDDTAEEHAELSELLPTIKSKPSETLTIQPDSSDEKEAEFVISETAKVLENSQIEKQAELTELSSAGEKETDAIGRIEEHLELSELPEIKPNETSGIQLESSESSRIEDTAEEQLELSEVSKVSSESVLIQPEASDEKQDDAETADIVQEISKDSCQPEKITKDQSELIENSSQIKIKPSETSEIEHESSDDTQVDNKPSETSEIKQESLDKTPGETVVIQLESSDEKQDEVKTADVIEKISDELESSQLEDITDDHSELIEKPTQTDNKPIETSKIELEQVDDKPTETLEIEEKIEVESVVKQSNSSDGKQDEVETVSHELECSQLEHLTNDQSELIEKPPQTDKPSETSEIELEQVDDKPVETLEIKEESSDETPGETSANLLEPLETSEEIVEQSNDDKLSKTSEESSKDNEELKQTISPIPTEVIEENPQDSSSADKTSTEDKESYEVPQSIADFQEDTTLALVKEESTTQNLEATSIESKEADSSEIIGDKPVSYSKDETETDIPSEATVSSQSDQKELSAATESEEINSTKSEESPKSSENITEAKVTSKPVEISEDKQSLGSKEEIATFSREKLQPIEAENSSLIEEEDSTKTSENLPKETQNESTKELKKSESLERTEKLTESTSEIKDSQEESTKPSEIVKSYNFEIKINDMDHKSEKETEMETVEAKSEKPTTSLRKRKGSQTTESSKADSELPSTRRTKKNTKTEENTTQIENEATMTVDETAEELNEQKSEETAVESKETAKHAIVEVSEEVDGKIAEVSSTKTSRRKRTVSESSQDSTQGEEGHSRSRRDRRKIIKKQSEEKLQQVEEEPQISKSSQVVDEKPKRKRTTSESSQGSVKDEDSHTRRGRRKVQKPPVEETVVEQKEECEELAVEQKEYVTKPEEEHQKEDKMEQLNSRTTEELVTETENEVEKVTDKELIADKDEQVIEISTEKQESSSEAVIAEEIEASPTKETQLEEITSELPKSVEINNEAIVAELENEAPSDEDQKTEKIEDDKTDQDTLSEETIPPVLEKQQQSEEAIENLPPTVDSSSDITEESAEESKPTISENKKDSVSAGVSNLKTIELQETQNDEVISSEATCLSNDVFEHKLSDIIELPEPEEVTETVEDDKEMVISVEEPKEQPIHHPKEVTKTVQEVEEMAVTVEEPKEQSIPEPKEITETVQEVEEMAVTMDEPKEQPIKRGRRKPTVSESSQGSVHEDENSRSRKTRRKVQKTPVEEAVVEEIIDTEEVATTTILSNKNEITFTGDKEETKQSEVESKLSIEIEQNEPGDNQLKHEQTVDVQCVTLEDVKEHTTKRGRRKPTVSESSQGSVHEEDTKHSRKGRRKVQKTPVEEIVPEENEEQITSQLETVTATVKETEEVLGQAEIIEHSADLNKETKENLNKNCETEAATITLPEVPVESTNMEKNSEQEEIKEHSQELLEMEVGLEETQEPVKQTHVEHDDIKEHSVKRGRRKRDLPESLPEEPTTSRRGRRKIPGATIEEKSLEATTEHENISNEVEVVTATETTKVEDVPVVATVNVDLTVKENAIESREHPQEKLNEESVKPEKQVEAPTKQAAKRGGRRKIDAQEVPAAEDKPIESIEEHKSNEVEVVAETKSVKIDDVPHEEIVVLESSEQPPEKVNEESIKPEIQVDASTKQTAKRGGRRKVGVEDVSVETSTKVEESVANAVIPTVDKHVEESNEEIVKPEEVEQVEAITKTAKRGGRRNVDIEEVPVETSVEKHVEETNEEIKKSQEAEHVETSTKTSHATRRGGRHKGAASETTTEDVSKARSASRNRKTPTEHPTSESELPAASEKQTEIPTVSPEIAKGRSASRNRKTPVEHPNTSDNQEDHAEVSKGRTTSRNRKTPVEQPMTSNKLEEPIESVKDVEEIAVVGEVLESHVDANVVIIDESTDEENEKKQEDTSLKKRPKRTRTTSETNQDTVVDEKPTKRRARHQVTEIKDNIEEKKPETVEEFQTDKDVVEKPQKSTRRRGAAASHQVQEEEHHSTKSRRKATRHNESDEHQSHTEHTEEQTKSAEERPLSEVKITEVNLEPEHQHAVPQEENQKDVKIRKGRRKAAADVVEHQQDEEEHETLASVKRKAVVKDIEHDHEVQSALSSKRRGVGKKNRHVEEHVVDEEESTTKNQHEHGKEEDHSSLMVIETSETTSTRRHVGRKKHDHDEPAIEKHDTEEESKHVQSNDTTNKRRHVVRKKSEHEEGVPEKHDTEEESIHIESSDTSHKRRHVGRKKLEHEAEHGDHDTETEHPQEEAKKGRTRRKKVDYTEEPDQPTTSHSPETKHRGRKRKESHTDTQEPVANAKEHIEEKSTKDPETIVVNPSAELQTPQRAAPTARKGRKVSTIEHITAESQELADDTPGRRARNVPQRRAATAYHNYDETSDSEVTTKTKKKTDSPRKSLEVAKTSPTAIITTAPIIDNSPSPSTTTATTTARGRTRKPTAKVQQFLEEERAKAETPKKRGLLASAAAVADAGTPQRTPARRGRKASTIETEVEGTPQASKGGRGGRGKQAAVAQTKEETETTVAVVEEKEVELHTTPPPAHAPVKGRRGGRKAKITEEEPNANSDEPPAKKSPLELESEKQDSSPAVEAPTPPTRTAGRRNAAAAAKARIEEDALAAAAIDPPKRSRAKKAPTKAATPIVATPETDAHSSELEEEKVAKNKNSPLKREHRLTSASTIEGADDTEDDHDKTETADKPANKRVRKAATTTTTTETTEVPVKKSRKAKAVEEVAENADTPGAEAKVTRGRGRGRRNVHFDEHQEAEASTSTQQQQLTTNIEPTSVETPEPVKRGTRTRRK